MVEKKIWHVERSHQQPCCALSLLPSGSNVEKVTQQDCLSHFPGNRQRCISEDHLEVSKNRPTHGYPQIIHFIFGSSIINIHKPSSYWGITILGNPQFPMAFKAVFSGGPLGPLSASRSSLWSSSCRTCECRNPDAWWADVYTYNIYIYTYIYIYIYIHIYIYIYIYIYTSILYI